MSLTTAAVPTVAPLATDAGPGYLLTESATPTVVDVAPVALAAMLADDKAVVIDVREPDEYARERIEGALLMPLSMFDATRFPRIFDRTAVLVCAVGKRSRAAGLQLLKAGFEDVHHLDGGMKAWMAAGLEVEA